MAKRTKRPPAVKNSVKMVFLDCTLTVNGITRTLKSIDYERIELEDGTVRERGLPPGVKPGDVNGVMRKAFE